MTFFRKTFRAIVHGESNDTLCASNRSKLVEKLSSAETYDEKCLSTTRSYWTKNFLQIDLQLLPTDLKKFFCAHFRGSCRTSTFIPKKPGKKIWIGKSEKSSFTLNFNFSSKLIFVKTAKFQNVDLRAETSATPTKWPFWTTFVQAHWQFPASLAWYRPSLN